MKKQDKFKITVKGADVSVLSRGAEDFIRLTDIAKFKNAEHSDDVIRNWLRNRNTIEFLGVLERLNNPGFKPVEFDGIRIQAGLNSFTLTPKQWIGSTGAIGITSKAGRYGGTYAHKDIAFEFASWISVEFIHMRLPQGDRLKRLNTIAIRQMRTFVRFTLEQQPVLAPFADSVSEWFDEWLMDKAKAGTVFTSEQIAWLNLIRDHIATSLTIEPDDFELTPFSLRGGLGKAHKLFGEQLPKLLDELNEALAA